MYNKPIPTYMMGIFNNICDHTPYVMLDIGQMNNHFLYNIDNVWNYSGGFGECYGYKKWKHLFIDDDDEIKYEQICELFPNSKTLFICYRDPIPKKLNKYRCKQSLLITASLLKKLLNIIKSEKNGLRSILIYYPLNEENELNKLIQKHTSIYNKNNFKISMTMHGPGSTFEQCRTLWIRKA